MVDALDEAARARLLVETVPGRFAFIHAIVRDALISELTMAKRARLHRALGEAILAVYGDTPDLAVSELAYHFTEAAVLGDTAAAARWATAAATAAAAQADHRGAIAVLQRALTVIEAVEPMDDVSRFEVAVAMAERHYALAEIDAVPVRSAVDAARRLGSGERMLRIALARFVRGSGATDPELIELYEEVLRLLDPEAVPLRALATAALARVRALQAIAGFTDDVETAHELLARIESNAPKVAAAVRCWIVHTTFGLPGAEYRLRLCDEALAVPPDAEDPWWTTLDTSVDMTGHLLVFRGHALLALGRRDEFEANVATTMELGETTGNSLIRVLAHARVALLAMLDGRFHDVPLSTARMLEAAPEGHHFRTAYFSLLRAVAFEQGRHADLLPMMDEALAIRPDLATNHASLGRICLANDDRVGAAEALDLLADGWTNWARDWSWPATLAETAEIVAGLGATEHARLVADELGPYAGELSLAWGLLCYGPFDRYRGMMLALLGRHDEAIAALTAALALEELIESPPFAARTRYWLARALLQRNTPGDGDRATVELDHSVETAVRLGMTGLARSGRELAERVPISPTPMKRPNG